MKQKEIIIVVPLAGSGSSFAKAGYSFPKPLIDIGGKPMIQVVLENLRPRAQHKFIFICHRDQVEKYSLQDIFKKSVGSNFEMIQLMSTPQGAACTVLTAIEHINNDSELIIANADQVINKRLDDFIEYSRAAKSDGVIMTFESVHPRWSYVRLNKSEEVIETAEKKVISNNATVGIYYFTKGKLFVDAAFAMLEKDIKINNEFYVCPVYNELILSGKTIRNWHIQSSQMHGLGTPEELNQYLLTLEQKEKKK